MRTSAPGVTGFDDGKFWIALLCYCLSLPLFFEGGLSWNNFHVVMPCLISFIVVTTLAWDYRIIGNPNRPYCLVLHFAFLVSLVFLLNRLMMVGDFAPILDGLPNLGGLLLDAARKTPLLGDILKLFDFVLKWLGYAVVLFLISGTIIFPPRIATALLLLFGLLFIAISVGQNLNASLWSLAAGLALQAMAFRLQMEDERKNHFWNRVAEVFRRGDPRPNMDMKIKIALLRRMHEEKAVGEKQIRALVASKLNTRTDDPRLTPVCVRIADQLATQDGLAESRDGNQGWRFVLTVPDEPPDFFSVCARVMRIILTLGFCILYILSPIDLIPDATPIFGVVDDMLLGGVGLLSAIRTYRDADRRSDHPLNGLPFSRPGQR